MRRFGKIVLLMIVSMTQLSVYAAETITKFNKTTNPTTPWIYSVTGEEVTSAGIKSDSYPLTAIPESKYLLSEPIAIANYDAIGINVTYNVSTASTHPLVIEALDNVNSVVYTHVFDAAPNVQLSVGGYVTDVLISSPVVTFKLKMEDAYKENEIIHVDEIQVYGTLKSWAERVVVLGSVITVDGGVNIQWAADKEAVKYSVIYSKITAESSSDAVVIEAPASTGWVEYQLNGLESGAEYRCCILAENAAGETIKSSEFVFCATASVDNLTGEDMKLNVLPGLLVVNSLHPAECSIYAVNGVLMKRCALSQGDNYIELQTGVYIMNQPGKSRLIVIP